MSIDERFARFKTKTTTTPNLWPEIQRRRTEPREWPSAHEASPGRRIAVALAALMIAAAGVTLAVIAIPGGRGLDTPSPSAPGAPAEGPFLSEGTSNGVPWTLVTIGGEDPEGVELRWDDEQSGPTSASLVFRGGLGVAWQTFGRFDPDDAVIFGVTPPEVATVTHIPGQGLPETDVQVIDVPGADWSAFVLTSYSAIGIVTANDADGGRSWNVLIVPRGGESVLETVEAFLAARIAGASAETFLAPGAEKEFGRSSIAPLYTGFDEGAYFRSKVLFLDSLGDGSWEVGVRLDSRDGTVAEDTLFVDADGSGKPVIIGLRGGTIGP